MRGDSVLSLVGTNVAESEKQTVAVRVRAVRDGERHSEGDGSRAG